MATQRQIDAGLRVLGEFLDRVIPRLYRSTIDQTLTEDIKFNLVLDIIEAAKHAQDNKPSAA